MESPPDLTDLEEWKRAARHFYKNVEANRAFVRQARSLPNSTPSRGTLPVCPNFTSRPLPVPPPRPNPFVSFGTKTEPPKPKQDSPVPMEVDSSRQPKALPRGCFRCNDPSHIARDCPLRFDIRAMTAEERRDLLDQLLAEADLSQISTAEVGPEAASEVGSEPREQDF